MIHVTKFTSVLQNHKYVLHPSVKLVAKERMVRMVSACPVPRVSTTMAPNNGVLIALLEDTITKRGQVFASHALLVLIKLN